jgi:hypothetical protein
MRLRHEALALVALGACRFGGPTGDPGQEVSFPDSADGAVVDASMAADDGSFVPPSSDATIGPPDRDGALPLGDDARDDASGGDASFDDTGEGGSCAATVAVCNPVHNTGCDALHQCDVDVSQTKTATGLCVFNGGAADTGPCTASVFNESCSPTFTCVNSACRELCFCDPDCPAGQCCSDTSGPPGFRLCRPCP